MSLAAGQKSLVQPIHSNLHVTTRNTRFYPLLRPLLLQRNFGIKRMGASQGTQATGLGKTEEICSQSQAGGCVPQWSPRPCGGGQQ